MDDERGDTVDYERSPFWGVASEHSEKKMERPGRGRSGPRPGISSIKRGHVLVQHFDGGPEGERPVHPAPFSEKNSDLVLQAASAPDGPQLAWRDAEMEAQLPAEHLPAVPHGGLRLGPPLRQGAHVDNKSFPGTGQQLLHVRVVRVFHSLVSFHAAAAASPDVTRDQSGGRTHPAHGPASLKSQTEDDATAASATGGG